MSMTWRAAELQGALLEALGRQNRDNAVHLAGESALRAPIETGDLRGSLEPGGANSRWKEERGGLEMTIGSDLPYAAKQHEDLSLNHNGPEVPGGEAKYLEKPLNENRERYLALLAQAAKGVMSGGSGG